MEYNLVSPFTNFLAVIERADKEKPDSLPALRTVAHNIPRSWGGVGGFGVMADMPLFSMAHPVDNESLLEAWDKPLMAAMAGLAATYPRFGYQRINVFMERLEHVMGADKAFRL